MKGKPGTLDEQARKARLREKGCTACLIDGKPPGQRWENIGVLHHLLRAGKKIGEHATVLLCPPHHVDGPCSWHGHRREFRRRYGSDQQLLDRANEEIGCETTDISERPRRAYKRPSKLVPRR